MSDDKHPQAGIPDVAKALAVGLELATAAERDMWRDRAQRAEAALTEERAHSDRMAEAMQWAVSQQPKDDSCDTWVSDARAALAARKGGV